MNVTATSSGAGPAALRGPGGQLGKDQFLQLLVAQLRHQDPMNPADPKDFAAQLAQFSTLEQLINMGDQLKLMNATDRVMLELVNGSSALGVIGKDVLAAGDAVMIGDDGDASITFDSSGPGAATIRIFDMQGREVGSRNIGSINAGRQTVPLGDAAADLEPGRYRYTVEVSGSEGVRVPVQTFIAAQVTGVKYTGEGPVLMCGEITVPLGSVVQVSTRR